MEPALVSTLEYTLTCLHLQIADLARHQRILDADFAPWALDLITSCQKRLDAATGKDPTHADPSYPIARAVSKRDQHGSDRVA